MLQRWAYILNRYVLADSGELTVPLGLRDPITSLGIELRAQNGASYNHNNPMAKCLTTFEIIDGSKVLFSLTGAQLFAYTAYRLGYIPEQLVAEPPGLYQNLFAQILFGRWWGDGTYAFDPSKFVNPQLRVKWNLGAVNTVGATGYLSGTGQLTVLADVREGIAAPQAFLQAKQVYQFTTAASGVTYVDLPLDQRLKALMVRSASDSGGGLYGISNLKMTADQDKFIPFDLRTTDFERLQSLKNRPFRYHHFHHIKSGDVVYPFLKYLQESKYTPEPADTVVGSTTIGDGSETVTVYIAGSATSSYQNVRTLQTGYMPFHTGYHDLGEWDDPNTWFDPTAYKALQLQLTNNVASSDASVVVEQEYIY